MDALQTDESKRARGYERLESFGDFRGGSMSVSFSKGGKKHCLGHQPGHILGMGLGTSGVPHARERAWRNMCGSGRNWSRPVGRWKRAGGSRRGVRRLSKAMSRFAGYAPCQSLKM